MNIDRRAVAAGGALTAVAIAIAIVLATGDGSEAPDAFLATPLPPTPAPPTATPTVIVLNFETPGAGPPAADETGCRVRVTTENRGTQPFGEGLATDIRVDVTDQDGNPLPGYTVEADLTKAGTPSTTSATTADEGRITFRVQTTQPGINTFAISRVIDPNQIRCNFHVPPPEPQAWTPGEEAAPTPTPDLATLGISCDHRIPGVESDIIVRGSGEPGRLVTLLLSGPGVIGSGEYVATADANGNFGVRMPINRFGPYIVDVDFQWQYSITVGDVCDG